MFVPGDSSTKTVAGSFGASLADLDRRELGDESLVMNQARPAIRAVAERDDLQLEFGLSGLDGTGDDDGGVEDAVAIKVVEDGRSRRWVPGCDDG